MTKSLDEIADRLYELPPATFVSARDDEVSNARSAGDKEAAKAIAGLRRPTVAAWLVNLLSLRCRDELSELLDIGAAMRAAQSSLKGSELRELTNKRRKAVARLVGESAELAAEAGVARAGLPLSEVETTLNAALANEDIARDVQSARLVKAVHYDGFGEMPRPDLQLVPGGRASEPAASGSAAGATRAPRAAERATTRKAAAERGGAAGHAGPAKAAEPEARKVSSAALARRRSAARKLHQAEVALNAARNSYKAAEDGLRAAENAHAQAQAAYEAAERDLQE